MKVWDWQAKRWSQCPFVLTWASCFGRIKQHDNRGEEENRGSESLRGIGGFCICIKTCGTGTELSLKRKKNVFQSEWKGGVKIKKWDGADQTFLTFQYMKCKPVRRVSVQCTCTSVFKARARRTPWGYERVAGQFDWQDTLDLSTSNNKQSWLLSLTWEGGGGGEGERERWPDRPQTHTEHNVSAGSNNHRHAHLSFSPSVSLVQLLLACQSVLLPVQPFASLGLSCGLPFSFPRHHVPPPLLSVTPRTPFIQSIYPCLPVSLICCPCPRSVLYLSALLSPLSLCPPPPRPKTFQSQLSPLTLSPHCFVSPILSLNPRLFTESMLSKIRFFWIYSETLSFSRFNIMWVQFVKNIRAECKRREESFISPMLTLTQQNCHRGRHAQLLVEQ